MKKVLFFTCEPGGAEVLIPVIELLRDNPLFAVNVVGYGYAVERFTTKKINYDLIDPVEKNDVTLFETYSPDILITSATSLPDKDMSEKYLWENAKRIGIKSIAFLDQWQNYAIRFSGIKEDQKLIYQPDFINAINQIAINEMLPLGFHKKSLLAFGHPYLSSIKFTLANIDKNRILANMKIEDTKEVFLFISEAIKENFSNSRGYDQYIVLDLFLQHMMNRKNISIVIKLHPKDDAKKFNDIFKRYSELDLKIVKNEYTSLEMISIANTIVGMTSIMLIEAYILGKHVISFQPNLLIDDPLIISKNNYISKSYTHDLNLEMKHTPNIVPFEYEFNQQGFVDFLNLIE